MDTFLRVVQYVGGFALLSLALWLPLTIPRRTRAVGGAGLQWVSLLAGAAVWINAAAIAYHFSGWIGLVLGFVLLGIGVVPIAAIAATMKGEWSVAVGLGFYVILVWAIRALGLWADHSARDMFFEVSQ